MASIVSGVTFDINADYAYSKPKVNANGRKQIGIMNPKNKKTLYISTPLMLTWGINEYTDEKTGACTYDMALQFPNDEYNNPDCLAFLKNMQELEQKLKSDAIENSKEWLNKIKLVPEAVDALWTPMLKYPKDKETGEPDYSRSPTLKIKIPYWEGEFKNVELYDENREMIFPNENDTSILEYITKTANVATIIQCGGIWVANGKFGVTWKLFQAVVKPPSSLSGKCHISLTEKEKEKLTADQSHNNTIDDNSVKQNLANVLVDDSDDDMPQEKDTLVKEDIREEIQAELETKAVVTEDAPKKKKVVKKKPVTEAS